MSDVSEVGFKSELPAGICRRGLPIFAVLFRSLGFAPLGNVRTAGTFVGRLGISVTGDTGECVSVFSGVTTLMGCGSEGTLFAGTGMNGSGVDD
jgi:hypothetical protein